MTFPTATAVLPLFRKHQTQTKVLLILTSLFQVSSG